MWDDLIKDAHNRFASLDVEISGWIERYKLEGGKIHCGRGCSNCCTLTVNLTFPEALCAVERMSEKHHLLLNDQMAKLLDISRKAVDFKDFLKRHRKDVGNCIFLNEDGSCEIYSCRPISCRSLISTRNSSWCAVDFAELDDLDKRLYLESLDRNVVAFPVHYVKAIQDSARYFEKGIYSRMEDTFGFSLSGNLCALIYLETEHNIGNLIRKGYEETKCILSSLSLDTPYFIQLFRTNVSTS